MRGWMLAGLLLCGASRSLAQAPPPTVAVVLSADAETQRRLQRGLAETEDLPLQLRFATLPNVASHAESADEPALLRALADARSLYVAAEFERCLAALPGADQVSALLRRQQRRLSGRLALWRLACQVGAGETEQARLNARSFATLGLEVPADVDAVSPEVESLLSDAQRWAAAEPRVTLRVESASVSMVLKLNGRATGCSTPCSLEVVPGDHVLRGSADGYVPQVVLARAAGEAAPVQLRPERAPPSLAAEQWSRRFGVRGDHDSAASMRLLAVALRAQQLVWLESSDRPQGRVLRGAYANDGQVAARAQSEPLSDAALEHGSRELLHDLLVEGKLIESRPMWKNPWFWAVTGVVAASAATVAAVLARDPETRTEVRFGSVGEP